MVRVDVPQSVERRHRPSPVVVMAWILFFLGVTALAGGIAMTFGVGPGEVMVPEEWLADIPLIDSWVLPGLILGLVFGVGSLLTGYGVWRRPRWSWLASLERATGHHWSWLATVLIGAGHVAWILLEVIYLPEFTWFYPLYGAVGLALLLLPFLPSVRGYLRAR